MTSITSVFGGCMDWLSVRQAAVSQARRRGATSDEAQDVAGEVMAYIAKARPAMLDPEAYARRAADREWDRLIAQKRKRRQRECRAIEEALHVPAPVERTDARATVARSLEALSASLSLLGEQDRMILALVALGLRSSQIGTVLGMPAEVVRKRLQRARERSGDDGPRELLKRISEAMPELSPEERLSALSAVGVTCAQVSALIGRPQPRDLGGKKSRRGARLTAELADEAKRLIGEGHSDWTIGKRLGVHHWSIRQIREGRSWR